MKKFMIEVVRWAMAVIKKAITWAAVRLLGTAILAVAAKVWLILTMPGIGGI
ncbi:hypothetical protein N5D99_18930 [Aeromonas caviae]|uniref:hypothetical protein n=1 Tax=Aeromonas caviae TaxID=648 RepID=UPI00244A6045|nr:hypothetical protein [Aeromonas caviae]MDH1846933.1 hypothetical protein [Aeromonas caviae]